MTRWLVPALWACLGFEAEVLPVALQGQLGFAAQAGSLRTVETAVFMQTLERLQAELRQEQALRGQADMALAAMQAQVAQAAGKEQQQQPTDGGTRGPGRPSHVQNGGRGRRLRQAAAGGAWDSGQPYPHDPHAPGVKSGPGQLCPLLHAAASRDEAGEDHSAANGSEGGSDATGAATVLAAHSDAGHLTAPADGQALSVAATLDSISPSR